MEISHNLPNSLVDFVIYMSGFISHKRFSFTIRENVEFILLFIDLLNFLLQCNTHKRNAVGMPTYDYKTVSLTLMSSSIGCQNSLRSSARTIGI